jgi:hypothetical protein
VSLYLRPVKDRLLEKIVAGSGGCWVWVGQKDWKGYGKIKLNGRTMGVHRVSYELHVGPIIPPDSYVVHSCDVPACCRPDHLSLGTPRDNERDKIAKGRRPSTRGSNHGTAKLLEADVHDIRRRLKAGESTASIAREKKMSPSAIYDIKTGKRWGWLPEEP